MLDVKNLSAAYGRIEALRKVDIKVEEGEIVTLLGSNGAGKSSTLKSIVGLLKPSGGSITYQGRDIRGQSAEATISQGISLVPEGRLIFPKMTVEENLELGAYLVNNKALIKERKERGFNLFPILAKRRTQKGGTLSGGEQQMLAIARALMQAPRLLLLDEPSMGLAPLLVDFIFETIQTLNKEGTTILLVEQNARKALQIAHRGYVIRTGEVVLSGKAADLAAMPEVQEAYLGSA